MEISSNLTLELFNQPFLLEKRIELLFAIERVGSISKAAKEVPMSYKSAWEAVDAMNNLSHTPILTKVTGGAGGGGTQLTAYGKNLLKSYTLLKEEQKKFLEHLRTLTDIDTGTFKTIGRIAMQISARNQIQGYIKKIEKGRVNAKIVVELGGGNSLVSIITHNAVEALNLQEDDEVTSFFKSNSVFIGVGNNLAISARNQLKGVIERIHLGEVNGEVVVNIGSSNNIVSIITKDAINNMELKEGMEVSAIIKASDVMIGR
ncbi:TOBE domain-containing protein [bacterium]|nr:TOBE domain-containing protein [bacterium]MBU1958023.1 TOBE domain-containing protein [bacterium]